jgi:hypothetical protein
MKNTSYILLLIFAVSFTNISCLREDTVSDPVISGVKMYMTDKNNKDSLITTVFKGSRIKFVVETKADMVSVWPAGVRTVMKTKSGADSLDMFKHPVLEVSDSYADYGLVKARGLNTTVGDNGWYVFYTYPNAGDYDLTIVATNHGYDGPELRRIIHQAGKISVR